jgi:hypothetical protein
MTDEQLNLMARVLLGLCAAFDCIEPYNWFGVNAGRCRLCGVVGDLCYPDIFYEHKSECLMSIAGQLQKSLRERKEQ